MSQAVKLLDVVEALEMVSDTHHAYLHRPTGRIVLLSDEELAAAESEDEASESDDESAVEAKEVLDSDDYLELPTSFDIHEYSIMERFSLGVADEDLRDELLTAISGRGAFRWFREVIRRRGVAEDWYRYRREALGEIATDWLEANGVSWDTSDGGLGVRAP